MRYAGWYVWALCCVCVRERATDGGGAGNKIGVEGARAIGEALQHCSSLQTLGLGCELTGLNCVFLVVVMSRVCWRLLGGESA